MNNNTRDNCTQGIITTFSIVNNNDTKMSTLQAILNLVATIAIMLALLKFRGWHNQIVEEIDKQSITIS